MSLGGHAGTDEDRAVLAEISKRAQKFLLSRDSYLADPRLELLLLSSDSGFDAIVSQRAEIAFFTKLLL